jgi:hypothetical protein
MLWERAVCANCGWTGKSVLLGEVTLNDEEAALISEREITTMLAVL